MFLENNEIKRLVKNGKNMMFHKKLTIIYNSVGFTKKIDSTQEDSDFFSNKEIGSIIDALYQNRVSILPYYNELDFLNDILTKKINKEELIVWNLSRQGSNNNQKSLITSFCDFNKIPYLGSSVYSMNLARNKTDFQKILANDNLANIKTYHLSDLEDNHIPNNQKYIVKKENGSASRGIETLTTNISIEKLKRLASQNKISKEMIIQPFIEGYEVEVPLFQINGKFKSIGIAGISINGNKFLSNQVISEELFSSSYEFYDFSSYALSALNYESIDYIIKTAISIANQIELKDYCRIDFRINEKGELFCFDISSTPYVTEHSSFNYLLNKQALNHADLLGLILGSFSSNIDSH